MTTKITQLCGWQVMPLGRLLESAQSGFASGERDLDGVIQMRMNNVTTDGNLDWTSFIRVPTSREQLRKYRLIQGDVLFNSTNSPELVGKTAVFEGHSEPVVFSNHFVRLRVNETKVDPRYLARWLTKQWQQRVFENLCTQWVNQAAVRKDDLLSLQVPVPPLPEQQRIASILGRADRLRRLRRTARELGDTCLQSVFLEMFGDPVTNPMGWDVKPLGYSIDGFEGGVNFPPISDGEECSPWRVLKVSAVTWGDFDPDASKPIRPDVEFNDSIVVRKGDLLISRANTSELVGAACRVRHEPPRVLLPDKIWRVQFSKNSGLLPDYTLFALRQPGLRQIIGSLATGTSGSMKNISKQKAATLPIPLVPTSLQQQFAHIVHKFERLRAQQREAERQAEHLFQALLHRAFRGEV
jgi:type I restriction enzyme S subunit